MATTTEQRPWQIPVGERLHEYNDNDLYTHVIVHIPVQGDEGEEPIDAVLLSRAASKEEATIAAEDWAARVDGEVTIVPIQTIQEQYAELTGIEPEAAEEPPVVEGQDVDKGKLLDVPRVGIIIDDSDPTLLKLAFSGGVEIGRSDSDWVKLYNRLAAGKSGDITVTVHVAGAKKTHRRDSEGDVDAVIETKSLIVTDIHLEES